MQRKLLLKGFAIFMLFGVTCVRPFPISVDAVPIGRGKDIISLSCMCGDHDGVILTVVNGQASVRHLSNPHEPQTIETYEESENYLKYCASCPSTVEMCLISSHGSPKEICSQKKLKYVNRLKRSVKQVPEKNDYPGTNLAKTPMNSFTTVADYSVPEKNDYPGTNLAKTFMNSFTTVADYSVPEKNDYPGTNLAKTPKNSFTTVTDYSVPEKNDFPDIYLATTPMNSFTTVADYSDMEIDDHFLTTADDVLINLGLSVVKERRDTPDVFFSTESITPFTAMDEHGVEDSSIVLKIRPEMILNFYEDPRDKKIHLLRNKEKG